MRHVKQILWVVVLGLLTNLVQARVNVVTLPGRDTVQLTIYNSVDLTMVKEKRLLTFRKGMNRLEFSWANTLIDPTSVEFRPLTHAADVEVLDIRFPPRVSNTMEWHVQSEVSGEVEVEIRYFTSGILWSADYVAEVDQKERNMKINGAVKVTNNSGEDYENAQVRLVVGVIRLVEEIAELSRKSKLDDAKVDSNKLTTLSGNRTDLYFMAMDVPTTVGGVAQPREIAKEGLSEYYLYTVAGRDTIPNGWAKLLPSFSSSNVVFSSHYKFEKEQYGDEVIRFYSFTNNLAGNLGKEPLPDGVLHAFRLSSPDALYSFQGASAFKYIPVNEKVELQLGADAEVRIHPKLMTWEKRDLRFDANGNVAGWTVAESWEIELQNSKAIPVVADVRRNFSGDWTLAGNGSYEKVDANKIKFLIPLTPHSRQTISYQLTTRHGTNATR